jgi:hypothetical protein
VPQGNRLSTILGLLVVLGLAAVLALRAGHQMGTRPGTEVQAQAQTPEPPRPPAPPRVVEAPKPPPEPPKPPPTQVRQVKADGDETTYSVTAPELNVTLRVSGGACWIRVWLGNDVIFEGTLQDGDGRTWTTREPKPLYFRLGNPRVVRVRVNEVDLGVVDSTNPRNLSFTLAPR